MASVKITKKLYEVILDSIGLPLVLIDGDRQVVFASENFLRYFGKSLQKVVGKPIEEILHIEEGNKNPFDFSETELPFEELLITCRPDKKNKKEFYFSAQKFSLSDASEGLLVVAREVTYRRSLERQLQELESRYRSIIGHSNDAIIVLGCDRGDVIEVNKKACDLYGYQESDFCSLTYSDISVPRENAYSALEEMKKVASRGNREFLQELHRKKSGEKIFVEISPSLTPTTRGSGLLVIARDITVRKKLEEELIKLEKLSTLKAALSTLRHEINNPLTVIMGEAQLLMMESRGFSEKTLERVKSIHEMGGRISNALSKLSQFIEKERRDLVEMDGIKMFNLDDE